MTDIVADRIEAKISESTVTRTTHVDHQNLISQALQPVHSDLELLSPHLTNLLQAQTASGRHIIQHVFSGGGKRIRPALYFFCAKLVGYRGPHFFPIAAVCEYVHAASLLHDDVIDNSTIRRGKPTSNTIWGDESAVLVGDLIYSRASELMADSGNLKIVSLFARAIRLMSDGELLQLEHLYNPMMTEETYLKIVEDKTAILLSAACSAPAILANESLEYSTALSEFGRCLGFAFQLLDDALDYAGDDSSFGKKTLADLPEGKVTLPIILLRDLATPDEWSFVESLIHNESVDRKSMLQVLNLVNSYDTAGLTLQAAERWTTKALLSLSVFPDSPEKNNLETLARRLLMRFA